MRRYRRLKEIASAVHVRNPPIEYAFPDIRRWEKGDAPYIHVLESGKPGPTVMVAALTHGNEVSGAIVVDALLAARTEAAQGHADLLVQQLSRPISASIRRTRSSRA